MITIKIGDKSVDVPYYTMPGQAKYSIGLVLGDRRVPATSAAVKARSRSATTPTRSA